MLAGAEQVDARFYVSGVDVLAPDGTAIAVAFGDSWFEGVGSTVGANNRSVDFLNRRLERGWVVNQGIAGNRLLRDEVGEHALARFDRDVLAVPGRTHVLVHFGINDLGLPGMAGEPPATADVPHRGLHGPGPSRPRGRPEDPRRHHRPLRGRHLPRDQHPGGPRRAS